MIELPPPGDLDLLTAEFLTGQLLRCWQTGAGRMPSTREADEPATAHLVDLCAYWMLRLHAEVRSARHAAKIQQRRRRHLERLLERMQRRLQPRLRRALHGCLRGHVFSLRLRRRRNAALPLFDTWRIEIE